MAITGDVLTRLMIDAAWLSALLLAGKLLRAKLNELGVMDKVYITNVTKCRPPQGTKPKVGDVAACAHHLEKEIDIVQPSVIIVFGAIATKTFLKKSFKMYDINGKVFDWHTYRVVPVVHPAAQLHYEKSKRKTTEPDDGAGHRKEPIEYFNEALEKVFSGQIDQGRQHGLDDFR